MATEHHSEHEAKHPTKPQYLQVAAILFILTVIEVGAFYIPGIGNLIGPLLLILAAAKFVLVAAFYMHLKYEPKLMSTVFFGPLAIAASLLIILMALFAQFGPQVARAAGGGGH